MFNINYLGADQASFTLNFSKGASQVIGQYYQLVRLGKHGYRAIMSNLIRTADYLSDSLEKLGFVIMSKKAGEGLPLVAFRFPPATEGDDREFDEFSLAHQLRQRGWVVPAYTMAPHTAELKMMRIVVREDFTWNRCDALISDIKLCLSYLEAMDKEAILKTKEFVRTHNMASSRAQHNHPKFRVGPFPFVPPLSSSTYICDADRSALPTGLEREALAPGQNGQDPCHLLARRASTGCVLQHWWRRESRSRFISDETRERTRKRDLCTQNLLDSDDRCYMNFELFFGCFYLVVLATSEIQLWLSACL